MSLQSIIAEHERQHAIARAVRLEAERSSPPLEARLEEEVADLATPLSYLALPSPTRWRVWVRKGRIEVDAVGAIATMTPAEYIVPVHKWRIRGRLDKDETGVSGVVHMHFNESGRLALVTFTSPWCEELRMER